MPSPYGNSSVITGVVWSGWDLTNFYESDLWVLTWDVNGDAVTAWGDGPGFSGSYVSYGNGTIDAIPPSTIAGTDVYYGPSGSGHGKIGSLISIDGTLWGLLNSQDASPDPTFNVMYSTDDGVSWTVHTVWGFNSGILTPATFVNFGQDNASARDAYVYAFGGVWGNESNGYLFRCPKAELLTQGSWEVFSGSVATPAWSATFGDAVAVFTDAAMADSFNGAILLNCIYNIPLSRYLLTAVHGSIAEIGLFDAPEPWGPWTTVEYTDDWGSQGFPTDDNALYISACNKWTSGDGLTMWWTFSAESATDPNLDSLNMVKSVFTALALSVSDSVSVSESVSVATSGGVVVDEFNVSDNIAISEYVAVLVSGGTGMASGDSLLIFLPSHNEPPSANYAAWDTRNGHPALVFDGGTNESAVFTGVMPRHYGAGGVTVYLHVLSDDITGDLDWDVAWERIGDQQQDIDADGFTTVQSVDNTTVPGTSGLVDIIAVPFTDGAQMDSVAAGESFRLKVTRDAVSDASTGNAYLLAVELKET